MTRRFALALVATALALTAAPPAPAYACGGYGDLGPTSPALAVYHHYAAMRRRSEPQLAQVWRADATWVFDHRGCCPPSRQAARAVLLREMTLREPLVVESVSAPVLNGASATVTAVVRRGAQRFAEHFTAVEVNGAWALTHVTRTAA